LCQTANTLHTAQVTNTAAVAATITLSRNPQFAEGAVA
jgi:hypothetical protein